MRLPNLIGSSLLLDAAVAGGALAACAPDAGGVEGAPSIAAPPPAQAAGVARLRAPDAGADKVVDLVRAGGSAAGSLTLSALGPERARGRAGLAAELGVR